MRRMKREKPAFTARVWAAFFACALLVMGCPDVINDPDPVPPPRN